MGSYCCISQQYELDYLFRLITQYVSKKKSVVRSRSSVLFSQARSKVVVNRNDLSAQVLSILKWSCISTACCFLKFVDAQLGIFGHKNPKDDWMVRRLDDLLHGPMMIFRPFTVARS